VIPRTVCFVSDRTGITSETLGQALLAQFEGVETRTVTMPFVSTLQEARGVVERINAIARAEQARPRSARLTGGTPVLLEGGENLADRGERLSTLLVGHRQRRGEAHDRVAMQRPVENEPALKGDASIAAGLESGRSVRPMEPANRRSPPSITPSLRNTTCPGAWPGVW